MSFSRRKFIKAGALLGLTVAVSPDIFGQIATESTKANGSLIKADRLAALNKADFDGCLGEIFRVQQGSTALDLRLIQASDFPSVVQLATKVKFGECFALKFHGYSETPLSSQIHTFSNQRLGSFELFVVSNQNAANSHCYEAVINRIYQ